MHAEIVLAAHRDLLPKGSVKHDTMSKSILEEVMLAYHITAAIIIDMAIPLTRANRLAAMRKELHPYSNPSCEAPCEAPCVFRML